MQGLTGYVDELNSRVKQATGRVKQEGSSRLQEEQAHGLSALAVGS